MAAYSMDLRLRVLRDADAGLASDELDLLKNGHEPQGHA
jgi:hypothetical protein